MLVDVESEVKKRLGLRRRYVIVGETTVAIVTNALQDYNGTVIRLLGLSERDHMLLTNSNRSYGIP